jgi:signal transduction histidine kinase
MPMLLLDVRPVPLDELRQILSDIRRDDERASDVIRGMSALLRRREIEVRALDLNDAIGEVLRLLEGESKRHGVALELHLAEALPPVAGDRVHLQQVVLNLVINGMEAAAEAPPGKARKVTVRTARTGADVEASVHDTGAGIAPDHMPRLFDSFVTTKKDGMGLGLSIARSLIEAHGGKIWADNTTRGAMFRFTLPLYRAGAIEGIDTRESTNATSPPVMEQTS